MSSRIVMLEQIKPKIVGTFSFLMGLTAITLFASGNLAQAPVFRSGVAADLIAVACYVAATALYSLFLPDHTSLRFVGAFFILVGFGVQSFAFVFHLAQLMVLHGTQHFAVFRVEALQSAFALVFLRLHDHAYNIGLLFFGLYCLLIAYRCAEEAK